MSIFHKCVDSFKPPVEQKAVELETKGAPEKEQLKRNLESRHLQMIAIGGSIGTGLFVGSGTYITFQYHILVSTNYTFSLSH